VKILPMKKSLMLLSIAMVFLCVKSRAQDTGGKIYLSSYTISAKNNTIGHVRLKTGQIKSLTIGGDHAAAFKMSRDHRLSVQPQKLTGEVSWFDVVITVKTASTSFTDTFRIVKDDFIRNKVIAHRGAWKNTGATENSIAALEHAIKLGCEGSEFDVHMSADSLPMINHDPGIQGVSIAKTASRELLTMKLPNGELLPTLENYLKAGGNQNKTKLILEIKASELGKESSLALTRKVVSLVEKLRLQGWVDYISFDYDVCREVMKLAPYAKVAYLKGDKTPADLASDGFFGLDYHFSVLQKNPAWIQEARKNNLTINVWTVNERAMMEELLKQGVDFITTNEPELLLSLVK
jgi:glycerophosphoryl diester phosphodiesterase